MADEQNKPGPVFSYPSMEKASPSQPADGSFHYPVSADINKPPDEWKDPQAPQGLTYETMDGRSDLDKEEDQVFSDLIKSQKPEAFNMVMDFVREDLQTIGRHAGAKDEDVQKDLQLVDTLRDFISRTPDPRWKAWAVGMADNIRKSKRQTIKKK